MRKKIFVDAEVLVNPHFSGIGHYTLEILRALDNIVSTRPDIELILGVYFRRVPHILEYGFRNIRIQKTYLPLRITNALKIRNRQFPYDLMFGKKIYVFPNFTAWPTLFSKSVSIVYDLSFEYLPQFVEPNNQKFLSENVKKAVKWSDKIISISTNSQKEICKFYGLNKSQVPIIYCGINRAEFFRWPKDKVEQVKSKYKISGDYIIFMGNIEPRKNLKNLLLAYEQLDPKLVRKCSLLLVGARGWLDDEIFSIIKRLKKAGNKIQQPDGWVEDIDRAALYSGAALSVYPSLYEGFGLPPLESMACGTPAITSNNSSLPEVVGDAAVQVNAESVSELSAAMAKVLTDRKLRDSLVAKGYEQVKKYSWHKEAEKLLKILEEL